MSDREEVRQFVLDWIEEHARELTEMSDRIWLYAEPPLQEYRSSALHVETLRSHGFEVDYGVAALPTAFVATWGEGKPVLATYAEYDATEGLSQLPSTTERQLIEGAGGFQDMHNGLGVGGTGAALAMRHALETFKLKGTVKVFGTPAEKLCVGKPYMARDGLYADLDAVICWHPGFMTEAEPGWGYRFFAYQGTKFRFKGDSVYGARPWEGTSALDGAALMDVAVQYMREHILPPESFFTINQIYSDGGQAPTNLPGQAESWYVYRAMHRKNIERILDGLERCARGAAIATQTAYETQFVSGTWHNLPNVTLAKLMHENIKAVGPPAYTEEDKVFACDLIRAAGKEPPDEPFDLTIEPPSGAFKRYAADDFTEFTWWAPTHRVYVTYYQNAVIPSWANSALAGTPCGHKSMLTGARLVALTLVDLLTDGKTLAEAQAEYKERTLKEKWTSPIPEGQPPPTRPPLPEEHYQHLEESLAAGPDDRSLYWKELY
jgi:aminobenzoyl-glutamate utilization protein B